MILYNTTFHLDAKLSDSIFEWIKSSYISEACACGFSNPLLARLTDAIEEGCESYALHFNAADAATVERWTSGARAALMADMYERWGERALAFSTTMEIIDL